MTHEYSIGNDEDDGMKEEYDFSNGVRGKHYLPNAIISFPIYLDHDVLMYFTEIAESRGLETRELLNEILRRHMPGSGTPIDVRA